MEGSERKRRASRRPGHGSRGAVEPCTGWGSSGHAESWFCGDDHGPGFCQRGKIKTGWKCGGSGAAQPGPPRQDGGVRCLHEDRFKHGAVHSAVGAQMLSSNFFLSYFTFSKVSVLIPFSIISTYSFPAHPFSLISQHHRLPRLMAVTFVYSASFRASNANNNLMNIHDWSKERRKHRKWEAGEAKGDWEGLKVVETGEWKKRDKIRVFPAFSNWRVVPRMALRCALRGHLHASRLKQQYVFMHLYPRKHISFWFSSEKISLQPLI